MLRILRTLLVLVLIHSPSHARTYFVAPPRAENETRTWPSALRSIALAIDLAISGDEIWMKEGVYQERITIDKPLTILGGFQGTESFAQREQRDSVANPTVIDGDKKGGVVHVTHDFTMDSLTITNGTIDPGAGIRIVGASCTLRNVTVTNNRSDGSGGGLRAENSNIAIEKCTIFDNRYGGLRLVSSSAVINDSIIAKNHGGGGGGVSLNGSTAIIRRCLFDSNTAQGTPNPGSGPGIIGAGGAMYASNSSNLSIGNSVFRRNRSIIYRINGTVINVGSSSRADFRNCTFEISEIEDAFTWEHRPSLSIRNSIIVGEGSRLPIDPDTDITYSFVANGHVGEGNITGDPKFVDQGNGDYRLLRSSPCIESGTDTGLTTDFDGNPRPIGDYDMGAFEFPTFRGDIDGNGRVDEMDLMIFQRDWGKITGS